VSANNDSELIKLSESKQISRRESAKRGNRSDFTTFNRDLKNVVENDQTKFKDSIMIPTMELQVYDKDVT
jgi:hypothetical protein